MTARGRTVLVLAVAVLCAGIALGYPALMTVAVTALVLVALSLVIVRRQPALTVTRRLRSSRVQRGTRTAGAARIVNVGRLGIGPLIVDDHIAGESVPIEISRLRGGEMRETTFLIPTQRRGFQSLGPLVLAHADPFGLAVRRIEMGQVAELVVTPRIVHTPDVRSSLLRSVDGPESQSNIEGTLAFHTLRDYVPGDDIRHIHWKSSARGTGLLVKQHVDTARPAVAVICDRAVENTAQLEALDLAIDCAASIAASALSRTQPVWLHTGSTGRWFRPVGSGADAMTLLIDELTALQGEILTRSTRSTGLAGAIHAATTAGPGSLGVLVTTNEVADLPAQISALAHSYAVALVVHVDARQPLFQQGRTWYLGIERVDDLPTRLRETGLFQ